MITLLLQAGILVFVWFTPIRLQPTEHQSSSLLFPRRWTAARSEDSPFWSPWASRVFCCSSELQLVSAACAKLHTAYHPGVWLVCQDIKRGRLRKHLILCGSPDLKNFQQLLKRGDDGEASKERENKDAEGGQTPLGRHPTLFETAAENVPIQGYQVSHSVIQPYTCKG